MRLIKKVKWSGFAQRKTCKSGKLQTWILLLLNKRKLSKLKP